MFNDDIHYFQNEEYGKNECIKEKCKFYEEYCEAAVNHCIFGASEHDKESEKGCYVEKVRIKNE